MFMVIGSSPSNLRKPKDIGGTLFLNNPTAGDFCTDDFFQKVARVSCRTCSVFLNNVESWKTHQIIEHNDFVAYGKKIRSNVWENLCAVPGGHPCGGCTKRFAQNRHRRRHERLEAYRVMLVCVICGRPYEDIEKHMKLYHSEVHSCGRCGTNILNDPVAHYDNAHHGFEGILQQVDVVCAGDGHGYFVYESSLRLERRFSGKGSSVRGHAGVVGESSSLVETLRLVCSPGIRISHSSYFRAINSFPIVLGTRVKIINARRPPLYRCRICGYMAQRVHKTRELIDHAVNSHFNQILDDKIPRTSPCVCPHNGCDFPGIRYRVKRHFLSVHISSELLFE